MLRGERVCVCGVGAYVVVNGKEFQVEGKFEFVLFFFNSTAVDLQRIDD